MSFVFANVAQAEVTATFGELDTTLYVSEESSAAFPTLGVDQKFTLTLWDGVQTPEIVHVIAKLADGEFLCERAREGTTANIWSAGTLATHTITAESLLSIGSYNPRGAWDAGTSYAKGDGVSLNGSSYVAITANLNSSPPSADWMLLASKGEAPLGTMFFAGAWNGSTTYDVGDVVTYGNKIWYASNTSTNSAPSGVNINWVLIGDTASADSDLVAAPGTSTGTTTAYALAATASLVAGRRMRFIAHASNTGNCTLQPSGLAALPLLFLATASVVPPDPRELLPGEITLGRICEVLYYAPLNVWLLINPVENATRGGMHSSVVGLVGTPNATVSTIVTRDVAGNSAFVKASGTTIAVLSGSAPGHEVRIRLSGDILSGYYWDTSVETEIWQHHRKQGKREYWDAILKDQVAQGTGPQALVNNTWTKRRLQTVVYNQIGTDVALASDEFTLQAGVWAIEWETTCYSSPFLTSRIQNITDGTTVGMGSVEQSNATIVTQNSRGSVEVTLATAKALALQYYCTAAGGATLGVSQVAGALNEFFSTVKIKRLPS